MSSEPALTHHAASPAPAAETSFPPAALAHPLKALTDLIKNTHLPYTISVTETACGGLISASLLSVPGASAYFKGGNVLYTLPSRIAHGGWTQEHIENYDGPTPDVVMGLAKHNKQVLHADWALCESGNAGPTASGPSKNRQPGYLALAIVGPGDYEETLEWHSGSAEREKTMVAFAKKALEFAADAIARYQIKSGMFYGGGVQLPGYTARAE